MASVPPSQQHSDPQEGNGLSSELSVFFNGTIPEAIGAIQTGKKILVVYIAGVDEDSRKMDQITWRDSKVREVLGEQCVTLCLPHKSSDALHFSKIYPYQEIPTLVLLSHTGVILHQHGGFMAPSEFLVRLEQVTSILSIQKAVSMGAAGASTSIGLSNTLTLEGDECEGDKLPPSVEGSVPNKPESSASSNHGEILDTAAALDEGPMPLENNTVDQIGDSLLLPTKEIDPTESTCTIGRELDLSSEVAPESNAAGQVPEMLVLKPSVNILPSEACDANYSSCSNLAGGTKIPNTGSALLQVRLTNGDSIRKVFDVTDSLAAVKEFVDLNRTDGNTSYSFAVAYPRRLFNNEDMEKSLLELNLKDRATLVLIVSASRDVCATSIHHESASQMNGATRSGGIWKLLSYLNPLSYFTRGPPDTNDILSGTSSWQYGPDPTLAQAIKSGQQSLAGPYKPSSELTGGQSGSHSKGPREKSWGGNIHTLKHDEDTDAFKKGNAFWNGNSTQYGGDDSKK